MSTVQTFAQYVLPETVYNALRDRSQGWMMRCPCGHETSVWEMGGIRWKADGQSIRWGRCGGCGERYFGQLYRRTDTRSPMVSVKNEPMNQTASQRGISLDDPQTIVRLWIDGVGCWLLCPSQKVVFGGPLEPGSSQPSADLCFMSSLSRRHALIERSGESCRLEAKSGTVNGNTITETVFLRDGDRITLGNNVHMRFRQPSVLTASASLSPELQTWPRMFIAGETPASVNGIVIMDEVCLLGPQGDAHIPCPEWEEQVILHRRNGHLWCRAAGMIPGPEQRPGDAVALTDGMIVSGEGWQFRAEVVGK